MTKLPLFNSYNRPQEQQLDQDFTLQAKDFFNIHWS